MSGDVTYQALERLSHMPGRDDPQGDRIGGQYYDDVYITGGSITGVGIEGFNIIVEREVTASGPAAFGPDDISLVINKSVDEATTVTLPVAPVVGKVYYVKDGKGNAFFFNITVNAPTGTINGTSGITISGNYDERGFVWDGVSKWNVYSSYNNNRSASIQVGSVFNVFSLGAYTSISVALASLGTTVNRTLLIDRSITLTGNITVTPNITLQFVQGSIITVGANTLTVPHIIADPSQRIFTTLDSDSSIVTGILNEEIHPAWFGFTNSATNTRGAFLSNFGRSTTYGTGIMAMYRRTKLDKDYIDVQEDFGAEGWVSGTIIDSTQAFADAAAAAASGVGRQKPLVIPPPRNGGYYLVGDVPCFPGNAWTTIASAEHYNFASNYFAGIAVAGISGATTVFDLAGSECVSFENFQIAGQVARDNVNNYYSTHGIYSSGGSATGLRVNNMYFVHCDKAIGGTNTGNMKARIVNMQVDSSNWAFFNLLDTQVTMGNAQGCNNGFYNGTSGWTTHYVNCRSEFNFQYGVIFDRCQDVMWHGFNDRNYVSGVLWNNAVGCFVHNSDVRRNGRNGGQFTGQVPSQNQHFLFSGTGNSRVGFNNNSSHKGFDDDGISYLSPDYGVVYALNGNVMYRLKGVTDFVPGETVTGSVSGATGVVSTVFERNSTSGTLYLTSMSTASFAVGNNTETLTGGTSGATALMDSMFVRPCSFGENITITNNIGLNDVVIAPILKNSYSPNIYIQKDNNGTAAEVMGQDINYRDGFKFQSRDTFATLSSVGLPFDGQTGNFTIGQVVTGGTSGATGTLQAQTDSGATGVLELTGVVGTFQDNEAITDPITGAAFVNGTQGVAGTDTLHMTQVSGATNSTGRYAGSTMRIELFNTTGNVFFVSNYELAVQRLTGANATITASSAFATIGTTPVIVNGATTIGNVNMNMVVVSKLNYDAQTVNFTVGQVVTGATSGATGTINSQQDNGSTGTLYLSGVSATAFQDNEIITDGLGGSATANGANISGYGGASGLADGSFVDINVTNNQGLSTCSGTVYFV